MTDLAKLIERVSAATGPDREIDRAVWEMVVGFPVIWAREDVFEPETVVTVLQYGPDAVGNPVYTLDPLSGSIDAALALTERLLPGRSIFLAIDPNRQTVEKSCSCDIANGTRHPWTSSAYTAPLAIILATLRALQARQA